MARCLSFRFMVTCCSCAFFAGLWVWGTPSTAHAASQESYAHRFPQVWSAAVRLIRVDMHLPLLEQDEGAGFLLFEYWEDNRRYSGSLELVRLPEPTASSASKARVKGIAKLPKLPSYREQMILQKLERKLMEEYGDPPPPKANPPGGGDRAGSKEREGSARDPSEADKKGVQREQASPTALHS